MIIRHIGAASLVALIAACSQQHSGPQMSASDAAYSAFRAGDYARAEQGYAAVLATDPGNAVALLGMGEVLEATGRTSEALSYYRRAEASRNGAIRVFDGTQEGVTELAYRRIGELGGGHQVAGYAQPQAPAPSYAEFQAPPMYVEPQGYTVQQTYTPQQPAAPTTYAVGQGYQPQPTYQPQPAYTAQPAPQPRYTMEPGYTVGPDNTSYYTSDGTIAAQPYEPAPVQYTQGTVSTAAPARIEYLSAPATQVPTTTYAPAQVTYTPAPVTYSSESVEYMPSYTTEPAPMQYAPAPAPKPYTTYAPQPEIYTPQPTNYSLDPASYQSPAIPEYGEPLGYEFDPTPQDADPMARRPVPKPNRQPLRTPGYTIVDGVVQYAKDPASATTVYEYETMPVNIGTPVDVISSDVPLNTPGVFSAPRGVDVGGPN